MLNHSKEKSHAEYPNIKPSEGTRVTTPKGRGRLVDWSNSPRVLLVGTIASLVFFALTSPKSVPPPMLITGFVVLGLLLYSILKLFLLTTGLHPRLSAMYERSLLLAGTILPVLLLVMQSVGQLTVRDILTLAGLFAIGIFYVSKVRRS